jgi:hypothetical protein
MRMRATELPTVPKPKRAMRSGRAERAADASSDDAVLCTSGTGLSFDCIFARKDRAKWNNISMINERSSG